jgi:hypothetical protein
MAWTSPTTRVTGEIITASKWNTDIVDNLLYLKANLGDATETLTNATGNPRVVGDVVVKNAAADTSFTISTTRADDTVVGVLPENISSGADGLVQVSGHAVVKTTGIITRGLGLRHSATATRAEQCGLSESGCFAYALSGSAGGLSTVEAQILLPARQTVGCVAYRRAIGLSVGTGWTNITQTTELLDTDGFFAPVSQRVTIPANLDGLYIIAGYVGAPSATGFWLEIRLLANSSTNLARQQAYSLTNLSLSASCSTLWVLSAGDYVDLQARASATLTINESNLTLAKVDAR